MKQANEERNSLYESEMFDMSFRATSIDLASVKVYTNKNSFQIEKQISFDADYKPVSSMEYFAGSVLSGILLALLEQSKKRGSLIEEMEGVLKLSLANPLSLLGVKGYNEEPYIPNMTATIFLYVDLEDEAFDEFCSSALANSPIYNTLKRATEIEVIFKKLL